MYLFFLSNDGVQYISAGIYLLEQDRKWQYLDVRDTPFMDIRYFKLVIWNSYGNVDYTHIAEVAAYPLPIV